MKKFIIFLMMLLVFSSSISANQEQGNGENQTTNNFSKHHKETFEIQAYKNTPDPVLLTLYDAFSAQLKPVEKNNEIDVYSMMDSFLTDDLNKIKSPKKQVIFSFLVTGASMGKFDLDITIDTFKGPYKRPAYDTIDGNTAYIDTSFKINDFKCQFMNGTGTSTNTYYTITGSAPTGIVKAAKNSPAKMKVHWEVGLSPQGNDLNDPAAVAIGEYWKLEGAIVMNVKKSDPFGFDSTTSRAGRYKANVTVAFVPKK